MKTRLFFLTAFLSSSLLSAQSLKDAIRLSDNEQYDKATEAFKALILLQPSNGDNYYYAGKNYFRSESPDLAKQSFMKGIEAQPTGVMNYVGLGHSLWIEGKLTEAKSNFD